MSTIIEVAVGLVVGGLLLRYGRVLLRHRKLAGVQENITRLEEMLGFAEPAPRKRTTSTWKKSEEEIQATRKKIIGSAIFMCVVSVIAALIDALAEGWWAIGVFFFGLLGTGFVVMMFWMLSSILKDIWNGDF